MCVYKRQYQHTYQSQYYEVECKVEVNDATRQRLYHTCKYYEYKYEHP